MSHRDCDGLREPIQVLPEEAWVSEERALEAGKRELGVLGIHKMSRRREEEREGVLVHSECCEGGVER